MLKIIMEDQHILVVQKPPGMESQSSRGFEADMVSEIKRHLHKISPTGKEPYVGVIHRLDKPVGGVMVYGKTPFAAATLSNQVKNGSMEKIYHAVVCGKPVDNQGTFVDYLLKSGSDNYTQIVDMGISGAKESILKYRVLDHIFQEEEEFSLLEIQLITGRHHQIRVQMAGHGLPLYGDQKYHSEKNKGKRTQLALCGVSLTFTHPKTGKELCFSIKPEGELFAAFPYYAERR